MTVTPSFRPRPRTLLTGSVAKNLGTAHAGIRVCSLGYERRETPSRPAREPPGHGSGPHLTGQPWPEPYLVHPAHQLGEHLIVPNPGRHGKPTSLQHMGTKLGHQAGPGRQHPPLSGGQPGRGRPCLGSGGPQVLLPLARLTGAQRATGPSTVPILWPGGGLGVGAVLLGCAQIPCSALSSATVRTRGRRRGGLEPSGPGRCRACIAPSAR